MVNVDTVYQTVLLILNQQQRGYMTPDEFNKAATQVQLTIFEAYASDLNQQYRLPQNDTEYANRVKNIEQKLQFFQRHTVSLYDPLNNNFPTIVPPGEVLYRLGSVFYKDYNLGQYTQRNELKQLMLSPLTQPTEKFPIYLYENDALEVYPQSIQSDISFSYLTKPNDVLWDFTTDPATGAYIYSPGTSIQFGLDVTEQDEIILRILAYAGVIIQDPSIVQIATQAVSAQDSNEKQ